MGEIRIRKAELNDMEILLRFEQGVINAERPFDPTLKGDPNRYYDIGAMIAASHIELLVAVINNEVIGSGYARIEESKPYLRHSQHAYLGFMYTDPAHRGKGVNKMIIDALEQWAISRGITEMRLDVYFPNTAAIKAYEKVGFAKHMIEMRKAVSKILPLAFLLILLCLQSCKNNASGTADEKKQLLTLEHKWLEAEFSLDSAYLSSIIDNTFIDISEGRVHNKQETILDMYNNISERIKDSIVIDSFNLENAQVNLYDNTAVVTFIVHTHGKNKATITERRTRFYDVWVKREDKWKAVASQGSRVE